jgi:hypothetical protein
MQHIDCECCAGYISFTGVVPAHRDLNDSWREYRRAAAKAEDPYTLAQELLQDLGPARFCPACAAGASTARDRH